MSRKEQLDEVRSVTLTSARRQIKVAMKRKRPIFLWGGPGLGKSDLVADICNEMGGKIYDLRLALMDPSDIKGVLYYNPSANSAMWNAPPDLPSKEEAEKYPIVVLFLDEMNSAPPATQAAAYQLILNRRVGTYELPDNVVIVAAGNRDGDNGVTYRMPKPLANRFIHLTVRPDFDSWQDWAIDHNIHPDVVGYVGSNKGELYRFNPKDSGNSFPTPRSWSFVSELLQDDDLSEADLMDLISGTVGDGTALTFKTFRKVAGEMPRPEDILSGKVKELKNKDIGACYALAISLCYEIKENWDHPDTKTEKGNVAFHGKFDNVLQFIMDNFNLEMQVMLVHQILNKYKVPFTSSKLKNFVAFNKVAGKHIVKAMSQNI